MTLYLKYRPQSFADVVGQDHIVTVLEQAVKMSQISHAYLLCGTRGTGKTSVARILAKTILTQNIEDPVVHENIIKAIEEENLVDFIEIDAASHTGVDDIRDIIEKTTFSPIVAKNKVYIIDEVHMLSKSAFNALLKTLEEPPSYVYFILATTELHKVPDTIQSRCQRFLFRRVRDEDIVRRLQYIVDHERIMIERDALRAIARAATGSFRDAISLLDQLRSLERITMADINERVGRTSAAFVEDLLSTIASHNTQKLLSVLQELEASNTPADMILGDLLHALQEQLRDPELKPENVVEILTWIDVMLSALSQLRSSPLPHLVLEACLLRLCGGYEVSSVQKITPVKSSALQKTATKEIAVKPKESEEQGITTKEETRPAIVTAAELSIDALQQHWSVIIDAASPPSVKMSLKTGTLHALNEKKVIVTFPSAFHRDRVAEVHASRNIEENINKIFHANVRLECILESEDTVKLRQPSTEVSDAALEVFGVRSTPSAP